MNGSARRQPRTTAASSPSEADDDQDDRGQLESAADQGHPDEQAAQADREGDPAGQVDPGRAPGRVPAGRRRPGQEEGDDPDRDVDVEDPAPGRCQRRQERTTHDPLAGKHRTGVEGAQDRSARERTGRHPQEGQPANHAEGPRPVGRSVQVGSGGRRDRHDDPAAECLHEPGRNELPEVLACPGNRRADREGEQAEHQQPASPPEVGKAAGEGHRSDVDEQIAVDDPRCRPELGPVRQAGHDRRQGHRRDHQLEAREEDRHAQDEEQDGSFAPVHRPSVVGNGDGSARRIGPGVPQVRGPGDARSRRRRSSRRCANCRACRSIAPSRA